MLRYFGKRAVISVPAEMEFAAIFVPSWARQKAEAMKKTPALFLDPPSLRKDSRRTSGFQIGSPLKMMVEDDETMIPMKLVTAKPQGMVINCGRNASDGFLANLEKSGSLTIRVAKLAMELIIPVTIPQASVEPCDVFPCLTIGPRPLALTTAQMKNAIPAIGTTIALAVNK